jgi:hypothetical protein
VTVIGARRAKAAFLSGCESHPEIFTPAGSKRSRTGQSPGAGRHTDDRGIVIEALAEKVNTEAVIVGDIMTSQCRDQHTGQEAVGEYPVPHIGFPPVCSLNQTWHSFLSFHDKPLFLL